MLKIALIALLMGAAPCGAYEQLYKATSIPTTGTWQQGQVVRNSTPTVQGSVGSQYVTTGWICTAAGSPGTWVSLNVFTGS